MYTSNYPFITTACPICNHNPSISSLVWSTGQSDLRPAELLLGECRRQDGRPIIIASKFRPPQMPFSRTRSSARSLLEALDHSLEHLGVECIDLYQIHTASRVLKMDDLMDVLAEAVQAGKVRTVGVSNYSASLMRQAHTRLSRYGIPLASNQVKYNLLHRYPETNGVLDACRELNVALIAYSPLEQGVLTGKYRSGGTLMSSSVRTMLNVGLRLDVYGDTRGQVPVLRRLLSTPRVMRREKLEPLFGVLEEIARAHEKTIAQVALNWLLTKDAWIIPIPGAKNARQASENAGALGWRLTEEEHTRLSQAEIASR
ncbi:MAG: aldo/keto reductase [Chloroflexi bacterium]|nr:aldo/keto reductase [Chloroflexota bacterium]